MTGWLIAAGLVVLAFVMVAVLLPKQKRWPGASKRITEVTHEGAGPAGSGGDDRVQSVDADLRRRIVRVLAETGKINAIKELREATGWGLKESKDYVDALERDGVGSEPASDFERVQPASGTAGLDDLDRAGLERVMEEIRQGRKINAIKELRAMTGLGLKESKELVEEIERQGLHL